MKFSLEWLSEYCNFTLTADQLADRLPLSGFEVDEVFKPGALLKLIITGKVIAIDPHPNADRLVITQISDGEATHQIVTGATNIKIDDIVPVSLAGGVVANGTKIKASKLRGVISNGMLCSESELGLAEESKGIWILPKDTPLGVNFIDYANLNDEVLDIDILPNRGDCQSHIGMAREIASILGLPFNPPEFKINYEETPPKNQRQITVNESDKSPLYIGKYIRNAKCSETPLFMQRRLLSVGIRPISLFVDITNYVLLEYGQPLHAFDEDSLSSDPIIIRNATKHEMIVTLDNEKRKLSEQDLVICNGEKPVAIAGIMGDKETEITNQTTSIFLEAAYFLPATIRKSMHNVGLRSESSIRFEKGVDVDNIINAANRACFFYQTLGNATILKEFAEFKQQNHPLFKENTMPFSVNDINQLLGTAIQSETITNTLKSLGFTFNKDETIIHVPSWRKLDIKEMPCLAEEIARLIGLDNIPESLPNQPILQGHSNKLFTLKQSIGQHLSTLGLLEVVTFPMISPNDVKKCGLNNFKLKEIKNPISIEESIMRPSLLPSLINIIKFNQNRNQFNLKLFELGKRYQDDTETSVCSMLVSGDWLQQVYSPGFKSFNDFSIYHLRGILESLFFHLKMSISFSLSLNQDLFHPNYQLSIISNEFTIGYIGMVHPLIQKQYNISKPLFFVEINLDQLIKTPKKISTFSEISKFPSTSRDIAILAPKELNFDELYNTIQQLKPNIVNDIALFDYFESDSIGADKKSLAFTLRYQTHEGTLSDDDVNEMHTKFCKSLLSKLPISIR
ncbi:phenylalanine--tRNA ligase subunit beta [Candidatus Marinamargulisbacteria bacterium SCGC AG-410-N11]|nr:phenylalanine--tRNA ligase subunit beta [Candidatus Marinamargulisbacteria bacterium SCGC AG-410-N11]